MCLVSREVRMKSGWRWRIWEMTWVACRISRERWSLSHESTGFFRRLEDSAVILHRVSLVQIVCEWTLSLYFSLCILHAPSSFLISCTPLLQKEPSSDVNSSSPRLSPPPKRTRRQTPPSSTDTSPSPQSKDQRGPWTMSKHCTRWGLTIYVELHE